MYPEIHLTEERLEELARKGCRGCKFAREAPNGALFVRLDCKGRLCNATSAEKRSMAQELLLLRRALAGRQTASAEELSEELNNLMNDQECAPKEETNG